MSTRNDEDGLETLLVGRRIEQVERRPLVTYLVLDNGQVVGIWDIPGGGVEWHLGRTTHEGGL